MANGAKSSRPANKKKTGKNPMAKGNVDGGKGKMAGESSEKNNAPKDDKAPVFGKKGGAKGNAKKPPKRSKKM